MKNEKKSYTPTGISCNALTTQLCRVVVLYDTRILLTLKNVQITFILQHNPTTSSKKQNHKSLFQGKGKGMSKKETKNIFVKGLLVQREKGFNKL